MKTEIKQLPPLDKPLNLNPFLSEIIRKGGLAPSGGNLQPWHWYYHEKKGLFQFIDKSQYSFLLDHKYCASLISLGACAENIILAAKSEQVDLCVNFQNSDLRAGIFPRKKNYEQKTRRQTRHPDRCPGLYSPSYKICSECRFKHYYGSRSYG